MNKIKLLFDMEQLSIDGTKGTGIVRVADVLLHKLLQSNEIDVYPIMATNRGNIDDYLKLRHLEFLKEKIVWLPKLKNTTKTTSWYLALRSKLLSKLWQKKYEKVLNQYDAYLSLFSPISPIVYKSHITTFMFIHDLIPIVHPEGCSPKFVKKFISWMHQCQADKYFCVSQASINDFHSYRKDISTDQMIKLYLGADEKFLPVTDKKRIKTAKQKYHIDTPKYFLSVSEITTRKNLVHLLKSFVKFLDTTHAQDIALVLVGPVRKGYDDVANNVKGLDKYKDKIIQTGFADDADLAPLYSGAEAFIFPSLYEGFGLPILEAMQCRTAVICSDNTSLPEVGGDAALYISGKDEDETVSKLQQIYDNSQLVSELQNKSLKQAQNFSWDRSAEILISSIINHVRNKND